MASSRGVAAMLHLLECGEKLIGSKVNECKWRAHFGVSFETTVVLMCILQGCHFEQPFTCKYLLWTLYFLKVYPTEDVGCTFCCCTPKTFRFWVHHVVEALLEPLVTMFKHFDRCHGQVLHRPLVTGIIDTTECPVQRSMNANTQHTFYSGKKKQHTVKYELVWDLATELFSWVNGPFPGSVHDLTIACQGVLNYLSIREILLGDLAY